MYSQWSVSTYCLPAIAVSCVALVLVWFHHQPHLTRCFLIMVEEVNVLNSLISCYSVLNPFVRKMGSRFTLWLLSWCMSWFMILFNILFLSPIQVSSLWVKSLFRIYAKEKFKNLFVKLRKNISVKQT